jgi:hypothetical protein
MHGPYNIKKIPLQWINEDRNFEHPNSRNCNPNVLLLTRLPKFMGIVGFRSRTLHAYDAKV